jgi:hypothetical protein
MEPPIQPPGMKDVDDCPGRLRCHGAASFCSSCGDVTGVCDDPECDQHLRIEELRIMERDSRQDFEKLRGEFEYAQRIYQDARSKLIDALRSHRVMVPRGKRKV